VVKKVLTTNPRPAVRVRIVALAEYARAGQIVREQVARPVDAVARRPRLLAVAVQAVDRDDAAAALPLCPALCTFRRYARNTKNQVRATHPPPAAATVDSIMRYLGGGLYI
jgi:hypothetical protein